MTVIEGARDDRLNGNGQDELRLLAVFNERQVGMP